MCLFRRSATDGSGSDRLLQLHFVSVFADSLLDGCKVHSRVHLNVLFLRLGEYRTFHILQGISRVVPHKMKIPGRGHRTYLGGNLLYGIQVFQLFGRHGFGNVCIQFLLELIRCLVRLLQYGIPVSQRRFRSLPKRIRHSLRFEISSTCLSIRLSRFDGGSRQ